jgi:hypothetical protein
VRSVGIDQGDCGPGLALEDGGGDRQDRRDAGAGGDRDVALPRGRVDLRGEPTGGGHHLELVTDDEPTDHALAERASGKSLHPDPEHPGRRGRADGVAAAYVVAAADREVLTVPEPVVVGQLGRDLERDRHRVVGQLLNCRDLELVESGAHRVIR